MNMRSATKPVEVPPPPEGLAERGRALWSGVVELRPLQPHELQLLRLACVALDRGEQARQDVEERGLRVQGRFTQVTNPSIAVERNSQLVVSRLLRQLGLPTHWQVPSR